MQTGITTATGHTACRVALLLPAHNNFAINFTGGVNRRGGV